MKKIALIFLLLAWTSNGRTEAHLPTPYPMLKFYNYPNLSSNTKSQRKYFKDWANEYFDLYVQEFIEKNQVTKNLFPKQLFLKIAYKAVDITPDRELLYRSEFFRKQAADFMNEVARKKYPELFVETPPPAAAVALPPAVDDSAQIEIGNLKQQVEQLQAQLNESRQLNEQLKKRMQELVRRNRAPAPTPAPQESLSAESDSGTFAFLRKMSNTQKLLFMVFGSLLVFALVLRKR